MSDLTIQELLDDFVYNQGKNVTVDKVSIFFNDPDPVNRRIAYEIMNGLTGDAAYLLKCIPLIKDNIEVLWEFLNDYCSGLSDPYVLSVLIIEALKHIDCVNHVEKCENIILNWTKINPPILSMPEDKELALKIRDLYLLSLPVIANTLVNWLLLGVKRLPFYEFNLFPYFLANLAKLEYTLPEHVMRAVKSVSDDYRANYEMGVLSVLQYDVDSANTYFVEAAEALIVRGDVENAYNVILMWQRYAGKYVNSSPQLLLETESLLWQICYEAYLSQQDHMQLLLMSFHMYCDTVEKLIPVKGFNHDRILELTKLFEKKILYHKNFSNINFNLNTEQKDRINLGYMALSIDKSTAGSLLIDLIKNYNPDKFNIFFYDCGIDPQNSSLNIHEIDQFATVRTFNPKHKVDYFKNVVEFANKIYEDNINVLVYRDWLINTIGHAVCCLKPAPVIIRMGVTSISTGLSNVPYMLDYMGMASDSGLKFTEKLITIMPAKQPDTADNESQKFNLTDLVEQQEKLYLELLQKVL